MVSQPWWLFPPPLSKSVIIGFHKGKYIRGFSTVTTSIKAIIHVICIIGFITRCLLSADSYNYPTVQVQDTRPWIWRTISNISPAHFPSHLPYQWLCLNYWLKYDWRRITVLLENKSYIMCYYQIMDKQFFLLYKHQRFWYRLVVDQFLNIQLECCFVFRKTSAQ